MKIVKLLFLLLALLLIGFALLGFIKSVISYDCEIMVDKPLNESWAVTQDEKKLSDWLEGFQKVELVSGTAGKVGAVSNVYFDNKGEEMVIKETITDIVPNESISMEFDSDFMHMDYNMSMNEMNGKTKISTTTNCVGNSWFAKSMMVLIGSSIKAQEETNLSKLKALIENNTTDYFPKEEILEMAMDSTEVSG